MSDFGNLGDVKLTVVVVLEMSVGRFLLKHALCGGDGRRPGYSADVACEICHGKGVIVVETPAPLVDCSICSASGRRPGYSKDVGCQWCQSTGAQPVVGELKLLV